MGRFSPDSATSSNHPELAQNVRSDNSDRPTAEQPEVVRLRQEVAQLRQQLAMASGASATDATHASTSAQSIQPEADLPKENGEFIKALLHNLAEGIISCNASAQITLYNSAARRLFAWQSPPPTALDWMANCKLTTITGQAIAPANNPLQRAWQGESIHNFEMQIQNGQGQRYQVLVNGDPITGPQGQKLGAVITLRDITQFRQATQALQEREDFLRTIYNGIETSIFVIDVAAEQTFRYIGINPAHARLTGFTSDELAGKTPAEVMPAEVAAKLTDRYRHCVQHGTPQSYEECLPYDGTPSWWLTSLHPLRNEQGQVYRLIGTSINITRRKQAEAQVHQFNQELEQRVAERTRELTRLNAALLQTTAMLERRNQELDQFVYVASHDLKAPLRAIANLSSWLEEDLGTDLPEENQQQLQLLRGRVNRMEALINGLLEYSRVGRKEFAEEVVDVERLVHEVIDSLAPPSTFTIHIACTVVPFTARRVLLHQVFANLISNAIKHCDRQDGRIEIIAQAEGSTYHFCVTDNGPGIASEYHEKIFEVFQTLQPRDRLESTGIGLSIVKKILDAEGGKVTVESTLGQGTAFHIYWPRPTP